MQKQRHTATISTSLFFQISSSAPSGSAEGLLARANEGILFVVCVVVLLKARGVGRWVMSMGMRV